MGKHDSSRTRVQPVFDALHSRDPSGDTWLRALLEMARHAAGPEPMAIPADVGQLVESPRFEFPANPPTPFLRWLIEHPDSLSKPPDAEWKKWGERTRQKRHALLAGDSAIQAEALAELERHLRLPRRAWWRLEGTTYVDCALLTPSTVVCVEGKRTEMGPSRGIVWYPCRNQVLRVLDCAAAYARQTDRPHYFAILVVERDLVEHDTKRQAEIEAVTLSETVRNSLPHLTDEGRADLLSHYLGVTTWQAVVERFGLGSEVLPETVHC